MTQFWDILQLIVSTVLFVAYLIVLFHVVVDLFRDAELGGGYKALWIVGLLFIPVLTVILYLLTRGGGMAERERAVYTQAKSDADAYIRQVAGKSPAEQIADAKALLDAGTINESEYAQLKSKALA
ncbi:MAG: SHOCT domain-containing protein [Chromatiaceae bacterium]